MGYKIKITRYDPRYAGDYWMYSVDEAESRGLSFVDCIYGCKKKMLGFGNGIHAKVDPLYDKDGNLVLPEMVVPVIWCDYHPRRLPIYRRFENLEVVIMLASKRWLLRKNSYGRRYYLDPRPTSAIANTRRRGKGSPPSKMVVSTLDLFKKGFSDNDLAFFLQFWHELATGKTVHGSAHTAWKKTFEKQRVNRKQAFAYLKNMLHYMDSGMPIAGSMKEALEKAGVDKTFVVSGYKEFFKDKDNSEKYRLEALETLAEITDVKRGENSNGKPNPLNTLSVTVSAAKGEVAGETQKQLPAGTGAITTDELRADGVEQVEYREDAEEGAAEESDDHTGTQADG